MVYEVFIGGTIRGTAAERSTVPTTVPANTIYLETDTRKIYTHAGAGVWNEIAYTAAGAGADTKALVLENEAIIGTGAARRLNFSITSDFDITQNTTADTYDIKIADNAVKTNHITDGEVTAAKLAEKQGASTQSGDGTTTVFNIAHGFGSTPTVPIVIIGSDDARGTITVTKDSTNIIITYLVAPPTGTNNLIWYWRAS